MLSSHVSVHMGFLSVYLGLQCLLLFFIIINKKSNNNIFYYFIITFIIFFQVDLVHLWFHAIPRYAIAFLALVAFLGHSPQP